MEKMGREELVAMYRPDVERLAMFLPWLTDKTSADVMQNFKGENGEITLPFPVYGDIYLAFLDTVGSTVFMNPNYRYVYSRYRIQDWQDELKMIQRADIMSMEILGGILSRYILGGMTKAYLWTEAMDYQIFYNAVKRAKEIIEYWDVPIVVEAIGMEEEQEEEPAAEWTEEPVTEWAEEPMAEWSEEPIAEWAEESVAEEEVTEEEIPETDAEPELEIVEEPVAEEFVDEESVDEESVEEEPVDEEPVAEEEMIEETVGEDEVSEEVLEAEEEVAEEEPITEEAQQEETAQE